MVLGSYMQSMASNEGETPKLIVHVVLLEQINCVEPHSSLDSAAPLGAVSFNFAVFIPYAGFLGCWDLMTFCAVMTFHGLTYNDSCNTSPTNDEIESETEMASEDESEDSEP